jgi:hypothetical protein
VHNLYDILLSNEQHREHPVLGALLFVYCPAAAGWWKAGVGLPKIRPYDVVSHVLNVYAEEGMTLKKAMESFGLSSLFESVKKYIADVGIYRRNMPNVLAPELLPSFTGAGIEASLRFGNDAAFDKHFGGNWRNVLEFARVWAYVLQDWQNVIVPETDGKFRFEKKELLFRAANTGFSIVIPAWAWVKSNGRRSCVGFVSEDGRHDQLLCYMGQFSAPEKNKTWDILPHIYVLHPRTGEARTFEYLVEKKLMTDILASLGRLAKIGPYPPLEALSGSGKCNACLFGTYCFEKNGMLSEFVMRILEPGKILQSLVKQESLSL